MKQIAIVGGGLTGLVAAERLAAEGLAAVVLEAESAPGGACRSIIREGYTFDYTGHLLHVGHENSERYLREIGVWNRFACHERRAAIDVGGHITPYPIQINTHGLAPEVRRDCVLGFVRAWRADEGAAPENFRQWVLARFGEGFARHFFFPYNSKLFRAQPEELGLDWLGRYVPKPVLEDVVDGAFGLYRTPVGYNAQFRYPTEGGIEILPEAVAQRLTDLRLEQRVLAVNLEERWLETDSGTRLPWEHLVFTGTLPALVDMVTGEIPDEVRRARSQLRWVRVANLALGVRGAPPHDAHWLYYPDAEVPYYRVGIPSNHGQLAPADCHTLSVELSLDPATGDVEAEIERSEHALVDNGLLDPTAVAVRQVIVVDPAYVVFDHHRKEAVAMLRRFFKRHGIELAGRWAEWKYSAMEDALLDGMRIARTLLKTSETR